MSLGCTCLSRLHHYSSLVILRLTHAPWSFSFSVISNWWRLSAELKLNLTRFNSYQLVRPYLWEERAHNCKTRFKPKVSICQLTSQLKSPRRASWQFTWTNLLSHISTHICCSSDFWHLLSYDAFIKTPCKLRYHSLPVLGFLTHFHPSFHLSMLRICLHLDVATAPSLCIS